MKKTIILIALFIGVTFSVQAQEDAYSKDALKLTKFSQGAVEASFGQIYTMIPEDKVDTFKKELNPIMEEFYKNAAEVTKNNYTHDQIKEILKFYDSEIGKIMMEKQGKIMTETMALSQGLNMKLMPLMQKYMGEQ